MLELMKQRIEEANKPVVKSVELENAEKACAVAKQSLAAKQNDYTQAQSHANSIQLQQQSVEAEVNAAYAQYCEVVQLKEQKELELSQLRVLIDAQEADDDSMTNRLESDSASMRKLDEELNQIKR